MKRIFKILSWLLFLCGVSVLLAFVESKSNIQNISEISINISAKQGHYFITENQVLEKLNNIGIKTNLQKDIDVFRVEKILNEMPETESVDVYYYNNGKLQLDINLRNPIARIKSNNINCYLDDNGKIMPISNTYVARVSVFSGELFNLNKDMNIFTGEIKSKRLARQLIEIYKVALHISENDFLKSQIVQNYINKEKEFELIPRIGNHRVMFGKLNNYKNKFKKLINFYKVETTAKELNQYDSLNVMYSNQIICSKR